MYQQKKSLFANRAPIYFGGLLLGLAAGVGFYKAKKAMMPKFHEMQETREEVSISPGGSVRFAYAEDPEYFLIPGLPTAAVVFKRNEDGSTSRLLAASYGQLVEKEPVMGPITEEGSYSLSAELYVCAEPGAPDCTKLVINQEFKVDRNASSGDDKVYVDLAHVAQEGVKAGKIEIEEEKTEKAPREAPPAGD